MLNTLYELEEEKKSLTSLLKKYTHSKDDTKYLRAKVISIDNDIVKLRLFMSEDVYGETMSIYEIADVLKLTSVRVRQIEASAIKKLRNYFIRIKGGHTKMKILLEFLNNTSRQSSGVCTYSETVRQTHMAKMAMSEGDLVYVVRGTW